MSTPVRFDPKILAITLKSTNVLEYSFFGICISIRPAAYLSFKPASNPSQERPTNIQHLFRLLPSLTSRICFYSSPLRICFYSSPLSFVSVPHPPSVPVPPPPQADPESPPRAPNQHSTPLTCFCSSPLAFVSIPPPSRSSEFFFTFSLANHHPGSKLMI